MKYTRFLLGEDTRKSRNLGSESRLLTDSPEQEAHNVRLILEDPRMAGVVLSGPTGSGRRATAELAYTRLADMPRLVRLNGSTFGIKVPMGVLSFLLAQLDLSSDPTRHELVHGLGRLLTQDGHPAVVLLGRPHLIDAESGSVLAQLAAMKKIKLVVVCEHIQDLPPDIIALFRSGQLGHVPVSRLNTIESRSFLEAELGGHISVMAAASLQHLADSDRGLMLKLAQIWMSQGQLLQRAGTWVVVSSSVSGGPAVKTLFNSMISGLNEAELTMLYTLAIGGPVRLDMVHRADLTHAMDGLFASGHIRFRAHAHNLVEISVPLLAVLLRQQIEPEIQVRVEQLLPRLHADPNVARVHTTMRVLAEVYEVKDVIAQGEIFAETGYQKAKWESAQLLRASVLKLHVNSLILEGRLRDAMQLVADAAQGLASLRSESRPSDRLLRASQELELLKQAVNLACGEQPASAGLFSENENLGATSSWLNEVLGIRALAMQACSWAAQSRQGDALQLASHLSGELQTLSFAGTNGRENCPEVLGEIEGQLLNCELLAGEWTQAMTRAAELAAGKYPSPRLIYYAEIQRGILHGLLGDAERALQILEPCLKQMKHEEHSNVRLAVEAVVTHALMAQGRHSEGTELLLREPDAIDLNMPLNFLGCVAEVFSSLSLATGASQDYARTRLLAYADRAQGENQRVLEMMALGFALRLGSWQCAPRLESVATRCNGAMATNHAELARCVQTDLSGTVNVLQHLALSGNVLMATLPDNLLVASLEPKEQRKLAKIIGTIKRPMLKNWLQSEDSQHDSFESAPSWIKQLTKRESQVARMAISGKSNLEIAKSNGVSIRTIEGHLYQVYSKLQVRNRQELTAMDRASRRMVGQR